MFLFLAGSTAEVQTRLHQSFPGQTARAGEEGPGEEGSGRFSTAAVGCCCQAEESPRCPLYLSEWYRASSSHPHLSHTAHCPVAAAVAFCHIIITHIQTQNKEQGGSFSASMCCFSKLRPIFFGLKLLIGNILLNYTSYSHLFFA